MKIVFLALSAKHDADKKRQQNIISVCEKNAQTVLAPLTKTKTPSYRTIANDIKLADAVIIEGTESNIDIGRFIATALQYHKPILVLYHKSKPSMLDDESHRLLTHKVYDETELNKLEDDILKEFFNKVNKKKLLYRFNLMLSKEMNSYLMDRAKNHGVSKADYIRKLIEENME